MQKNIPKDKALCSKNVFFFLRLGITCALLFYIFFYVVVWQDFVILKDKNEVFGKILEHSQEGVRMQIQEKVVWFPASEIADQEKSKQKEVHFGFFSVWKKLKISIFFLFSSFFFLDTLLCSLRIRWLLMSQGFSFSLKDAIRINFVGSFFNNFLPGFTGGDLVRAYYLAKDAQQKTKAIVAVLMDRILGMTALILVAGMALVFHMKKQEFFLPCLVVFSSLLLTILGFCGIFWIPERRFFGKNSLPFRIVQSFCNYRFCPKVLLWSLAISIVVHIFCNVAVFGFAMSLGIFHIPWFVFFIYVPVGLLLMALPISISGWGVGEATFGFLFSQIGLPWEQGVMLSLLMRLAHMQVGIMGGFFWIWGKSKFKLE